MKYLFFISLLFCSLFSKAQMVKVIYHETPKAPEQLKMMANNNPKFAEHVKIFENRVFVKQTLANTVYSCSKVLQLCYKDTTMKKGVDYFNRSTLFIDFPNKTFYATNDEINAVSKDTLLELYNWELQNEHRKIVGYDCQKAVGKKKMSDKIITAWFAPDIPLQMGTGRIFGLPGAILAVDTEENSTEAVEVSYVKPANEYKLEMPKAAKYISYNELQSIINQSLYEKVNHK